MYVHAHYLNCISYKTYGIDFLIVIFVISCMSYVYMPHYIPPFTSSYDSRTIIPIKSRYEKVLNWDKSGPIGV
jgi:hypothetical protein